jgi:hypothetical protein
MRERTPRGPVAWTILFDYVDQRAREAGNPAQRGEVNQPLVLDPRAALEVV